jgi:hypothetical protein
MRHSKDAQANARRADARDEQASASVARSMRTHRPDLRSYKRRLKAAGLAREDVDDTQPVDLDALRVKMTRSLHMAINTWKGCPEPLCRRQRGCMAPNNVCTNSPPSPEVSEVDLARTKAMFFRVLKQAAERDDAQALVQQEADAGHQPRATSRKTTPRKGPSKRRARGDDGQ